MTYVATRFVTNVVTRYRTNWNTRYFIEYRYFTRYVDEKGRVVTKVITAIVKPVSADKFRRASPRPAVVMIRRARASQKLVVRPGKEVLESVETT